MDSSYHRLTNWPEYADYAAVGGQKSSPYSLKPNIRSGKGSSSSMDGGRVVDESSVTGATTYCGGMPIATGASATGIVRITVFVAVSITVTTSLAWLTTKSLVPSGVTANPGTPKNMFC